MFTFSQTYRSNTVNNKFTGYNWFTQPVKFGSSGTTSLSETSLLNFQSTYTLVNTSKINWNNAYSLVSAGKPNWDKAYSEINDTITLFTAISSLPFLQLPQLTTAEINALTPIKAMIVFDKTLGVIKVYNGTNWKTLTTN